MVVEKESEALKQNYRKLQSNKERKMVIQKKRQKGIQKQFF